MDFDLQIDRTLMNVVVSATTRGLSMTGIEPQPIGVSRLMTVRHGISIIVGLVGVHSGSISINVSEKGMLHLASEMLGEPLPVLADEAIDAMMELGNQVAGCFKDSLMQTSFQISEISLPSVIFGQRFAVLNARGTSTVSVEFEFPPRHAKQLQLDDRFFSTSITLLRGSGR